VYMVYRRYPGHQITNKIQIKVKLQHAANSDTMQDIWESGIIRRSVNPIMTLETLLDTLCLLVCSPMSWPLAPCFSCLLQRFCRHCCLAFRRMHAVATLCVVLPRRSRGCTTCSSTSWMSVR
jgi:hypothetical protein